MGDRSVLSVRSKGNPGQRLSSEIIFCMCRSCPEREEVTPSRPLIARPTKCQEPFAAPHE